MMTKRKKIFFYKDGATGTCGLPRPQRPEGSTEAVVFWDRQTAALPEYNPYLVHVKSRDNQKMTFSFLDNDTGIDLPGDHDIDLDNSTHVRNGAPSSAQLCDLTSPNHFGILLLTREYVTSINTPEYISSTGVDLLVAAIGDGKWPRSAGYRARFVSVAISALHEYINKYTAKILSSDQVADIKAIIETLNESLLIAKSESSNA